MRSRVREVLFWTAVVIVPGGTLLVAYRLGRQHRKIARILKKVFKKEDNHG